MKTTTKNKKTQWLAILLLAIGMFSTNSIWACSANFTYSIGLNGHVTFKSTSTGGIYQTQYTWNFGDNSTVVAYNDTSLVHIYQSNGTFSVILYLNADTSSCYDSIRIPVVITNVTTPCTLSAAYTYTLNANGATSFTSTSTGTNANTLYYWNAGDGSGTTLGTSTFSHTYAIQGYYAPMLTIKDTGSAYCVDSTAQSITITTADSNRCGLHANFSSTLGLNGHASFVNTDYVYDSAGGNHYTWNAGDGSSSFTGYNDSIYNHVYTTNGTYTVTLTVTTSYPYYCTSSISIPVTISNVTTPCTLSAGFNAINDTTTGVINIVSTSTGTISGTQYYWNPGNGSPTILESSANFNYTYTANGTYNGTLTVENTGSAFCIDSITLPLSIANVDSLRASFTTNSNYDTLGYYHYQFMSTSTGTNINTVYAWEPGDSTAGDTGVNMTTYYHTYTYPGAHTVTLSLWFDKYPVMPGHKAEGFGGIKYDFTSYSEKIYVGSPQGIATITNTNSGIKLFPNPNNGEFKLALNGIAGNNNAEVQITNMLGEVVCETSASVNNGTILKDINLQNVSTGTYFVRVITSGTVYNIKTVINR